MASSSSAEADLKKKEKADLFNKKQEERYENLTKVKVEEFVTVKLSDRTTYLTWKSMVLSLAESHGVVGFITAYFGCVHEDCLCKKVDDLVRRWILATVSENLLTDRMVNSKTSNQLWKMLKHAIFWNKRYEYVSNVKVEEFVTVKLSDHTTYLTWKSMMLSLAQSHDLLRFICRNDWDDFKNKYGKEDKDMDKIKWDELVRQSILAIANENLLTDDKNNDNTEDEDWKRVDEVIRQWILATLNENLLTDRTKNSKTSKELWEMLENDHKKESVSYIRMQYLPLLKASIYSDWEKATKFLEQEPDSVRAIITENLETALMLAARTAQRNNFVKKLVNKMSPVDLAMVDDSGSTALHVAARAGNIGAAKVLVNKNPRLPNIPDRRGLVPLCDAALCGKEELILYLWTCTAENTHPNPFDLEPSITLVDALIRSRLYDIACSLLRRYPMGSAIYGTFLLSIVQAHSTFLSGARLNYLQSLIYTFVPVKVNKVEENRINGGDIENAICTSISGLCFNVRRKLNALFWKVAEISVPQIKHVRETKLIHHQALQLVKQLVNEIAKDHLRAGAVFERPLLLAARSGVHEVVEEILDSFPNAVALKNENKQSLFHLAIMNRRENVFNIINQCPGLSHVFLAVQDHKGNNGLHLAGFFGDEQKPILRATAAGAALQMQRELQWFKEVEKLTLTREKRELNSDKKTPMVLFTETHQELVKEGEKWMKDTASSCTIVAALIVTIVFAAAITIPGGNNGSTGHPIFELKKAFIIFATSDALALFSSTSSLLLFLSILTSRYAEQDFLYALPKRLISGLVTLFISIIFMMIAFGATLQILLGEKNWWVIIPVVGLGSVPVTLFVSSQFPLLIDMIRCTYGSQIFRLQSDRFF